MAVTSEQHTIGDDVGASATVYLPMPPRWLQRGRRGALFGYADELAARRLMARLAPKAAAFRPDVVLSVMIPDYFMSAAAAYARGAGLPFVLLCHDDYSDFVPRAGRELLARVYRQAQHRFCVSKPMEEAFFARYGVRGTVLPPIPSGPAAPVRRTEDGDPVVIGFAGSIGFGYVEAMVHLADVLAANGGRLVIASRSPRRAFAGVFSHPAVEDVGAVTPGEVKRAFLKAGVNVLSVIQSFDAAEISAFRLNFPSKLTEYSTFGLPLLVVAPENSSASIWVRQNAGSALAVHGLIPGEFVKAVQRLKSAQERLRLAEQFHAAAAAFDPELLQRRFEDALVDACEAGRGL